MSFSGFQWLSIPVVQCVSSRNAGSTERCDAWTSQSTVPEICVHHLLKTRASHHPDVWFPNTEAAVGKLVDHQISDIERAMLVDPSFEYQNSQIFKDK
jgi:hypothetical protein